MIWLTLYRLWRPWQVWSSTGCSRSSNGFDQVKFENCIFCLVVTICLDGVKAHLEQAVWNGDLNHAFWGHYIGLGDEMLSEGKLDIQFPKSLANQTKRVDSWREFEVSRRHRLLQLHDLLLLLYTKEVCGVCARDTRPRDSKEKQHRAG